MPRTARKKSVTNIYHVMLRGINRQVIFEDDGDKLYFMKVLQSCKEVSGFKLHAFCLMPNHVHLLIEPATEPLEIIFKRIGSRYVIWYNRKYQRTGHLFQDRFKSENVEDTQYYTTVLRYIMHNPMKAGIENQPGNYRWSSFLAYEKGKGAVTDTQFATELFGSRETLLQYLRQDEEDTVMEEEDDDWRLRDERAQEIMTRITGCSTVSEFQQLDPSHQEEFIQKMWKVNLSLSQIARLTGISKTTAHRRIQKRENQMAEGKGTPVFRELDETEFVYDYYPDENEVIW